jgi:hypothetical protein
VPVHIDNQVYPGNHLRVPLWCVYGSEAYPSIICCMINEDSARTLTIWGYSKWKNAGGFRTMGVEVLSWADKNDAHFFVEKEHALAYLSKILTPTKNALEKLK